MEYKRILTVQDVSCVGKCSMSIALPILTACGHEVCILPTAVLSTHTGFPSRPCVQHMDAFLLGVFDHWTREGVQFDLILTGYLGSVQAVDSVLKICDQMLAPGGELIVDPAMADHGKLYSGLDAAYAEAIKRLCAEADIIIPNITEAAMMTGMTYREELDEAYVQTLLEKLGGKDVVLTGASFEAGKTGAAIRSRGEVSYYFHDRIGRNFHGTGDIFASAFTGAYMQDKTLQQAVRIAADYTCKCIQKTVENPAHWYGVKFETALPDLIEMLK